MPFTLTGSPGNRMKLWSSEDDTLLQEMRKANEPWPLVAQALGRTQASCQNRCGILRKLQRKSANTSTGSAN